MGSKSPEHANRIRGCIISWYSSILRPNAFPEIGDVGIGNDALQLLVYPTFGAHLQVRYEVYQVFFSKFFHGSIALIW